MADRSPRAAPSGSFHRRARTHRAIAAAVAASDTGSWFVVVVTWCLLLVLPAVEGAAGSPDLAGPHHAPARPRLQANPAPPRSSAACAPARPGAPAGPPAPAPSRRAAA